MKARNTLVWYIVAFVVSLLVIFFVGRSVEAGTGKSSMILTPDGLNHFRKGMDVAGGVRLTYKIDFAKYKENYANQQEYIARTQDVKDIILQNIDTRISKLWVSDYTSYIQSLSDGEYVVVEIWWVFDLDQAKEIIGKTVELEFKLAYEGDGEDLRLGRQAVAEDLLQQAVNDPRSFATLVEGKQGDNIYYQSYPAISADQLPAIYQANLDVLKERQDVNSISYITRMSIYIYSSDDLSNWHRNHFGVMGDRKIQ